VPAPQTGTVLPSSLFLKKMTFLFV
jgi:hypothetical protein